MQANYNIRKMARVNDVTLWRIAQRLNISEPTISRWLRTPLAPEREQAIVTAIQELAKEGESNAASQ